MPVPKVVAMPLFHPGTKPRGAVLNYPVHTSDFEEKDEKKTLPTPPQYDITLAELDVSTRYNGGSQGWYQGWGERV